MASYTVTLRADKTAYPVLLSNGNLVESGDLPDGAATLPSGSTRTRNPATCLPWWRASWWRREQRIVSRSGKEHLLQVYVRPATWTRPNTP
jgi:aminopeptidase N